MRSIVRIAAAVVLVAVVGALPADAQPASSHRLLLPAVKRDPGTVRIVESFGDPASGWPNADRGPYVVRYLGGEYQILLRSGSSGFMVGAANNTVTRFRSVRAEVTARLASEHPGHTIGLAFAVSNALWSSFYGCFVGDGWANVAGWHHGFAEPPSRTTSPDITARRSNRIRAEAEAGALRCYLNDQLVASGVPAGSIVGEVGVVVTRPSNDPASEPDGRFDDLIIQGEPEPPP
jgi:hypothetical protein